MSKCDIKVLYLGKNRNKTFISEQVAIEMGKNLRGAPIVGYYKESKEDFVDHGEKIIIDEEGVHFSHQTVPYGFVSPDAKVWFQEFEEKDSNNQPIIRKYLMTTGYLWTGQFSESSLPVKEGRPQSMEINEESLDGYWTKDHNGMEFFIINDAIISKICILGEDIQPCFQGASITAPEISSKFTLDNNFKQTLYSMMEDLKNILNGGQQQMDNIKIPVETIEQQEVVETQFTQENIEIEHDSLTENDSAINITEYEKKDEKEQKEDNSEAEEKNENAEEKNDDTEKEKAKKYSALVSELEQLKQDYAHLNEQCNSLLNFKREIDNQQKRELISEFYMLSDEDKKDVLENLDKYSLEDIKSKLAVICFDKKINFSLQETNDSTSQKEDIITYSLNNEENNLPEWVARVKQEQRKLGQ